MGIGSTIITNADEWDKDLKRQMKALEVKMGRVVAGVFEENFFKLLMETPQWSGFLAASWMMTINRKSNDTADRNKYPEGWYMIRPYQAGHMAAVMDAATRAQGERKPFKTRYEAKGWNVQVTNNAPHAEAAENGNIEFRKGLGHSPHFFERFQRRVNETNVVTEAEWNYYANTDFLGGPA